MSGRLFEVAHRRLRSESRGLDGPDAAHAKSAPRRAAPSLQERCRHSARSLAGAGRLKDAIPLERARFRGRETRSSTRAERARATGAVRSDGEKVALIAFLSFTSARACAQFRLHPVRTSYFFDTLHRLEPRTHRREPSDPPFWNGCSLHKKRQPLLHRGSEPMRVSLTGTVRTRRSRTR